MTKKSVISQDPTDALQEHISSIQRELSEQNVVYDEYQKLDSPPHDMRRKLDNCIAITSQIVENAQTKMGGNDEELFGLMLPLYLQLLSSIV